MKKILMFIIILGVSIGLAKGQENTHPSDPLTTIVLLTEETLSHGYEEAARELIRAGLPDHLVAPVLKQLTMMRNAPVEEAIPYTQRNSVFVYGRQVNCPMGQDAFALWQMGIGFFTSGWTSNLKTIVASGTSTNHNFYAVAYADITQSNEWLISHSLYVSSTYVHGYNAWCL